MDQSFIITTPDGRLVIRDGHALALLDHAITTIQQLSSYARQPKLIICMDAITVESVPKIPPNAKML